MFGTILAIGGFIGADVMRRSARRGLFRSMLKGGMVKGVGVKEARRALIKNPAGKKLFADIYKRNRGQAARFARKASGRGGDRYIRSQVRAGSAYQMRAAAMRSPAGRLPTGWGSETVKKFGGTLAVGVHKYNTLGGIGGVAAMIGMTGIGMQLGGVGGSMSERVPMAPSQEVQNANMYIMPRQAYTQRQRSMQAISMTQLSLRSAFGQEARYMHR